MDAQKLIIVPKSTQWNLTVRLQRVWELLTTVSQTAISHILNKSLLKMKQEYTSTYHLADFPVINLSVFSFFCSVNTLTWKELLIYHKGCWVTLKAMYMLHSYIFINKIYSVVWLWYCKFKKAPINENTRLMKVLK